MKVLLAVDGSKHTKKMLAYLEAHGQLLGGSPEYVVATVEAPVPARASRYVGKEIVDKYYHERAEAILSPVCKFLTLHNRPYQTRALVGDAANELLKLADKEMVELIVMGSHGHGRVLTALIGSVAQKVLSRCKVPVLVVR